jgi:hypothetical protein
MTKQDIIDAWTEVGKCEAAEFMLGEQLVELTILQRKAHAATRSARDIAENLLEDNNK